MFFSDLQSFISISEAVILITSGALAIILQVAWGTHVARKMRIAYTTSRRIQNSNQINQDLIVHLKNCKNIITQGKLLLTVLVLEFVSCGSYWLAFLYPELSRVIPHLNETSLPFNSTCISQVSDKKIWIKELHYPPVFFFLSLARSSFILVLGVALSLFRYNSNTYVTGSWKYKNIYRPIKITVILSLIIFILGLLPQLVILSRILVVLLFPIYYTQLLIHSKFLHKVMKWREQDLFHNNEPILLKLQKKQTRYFTVTTRSVSIALLLYFLATALQSIEMISFLLLYYGKCFFPYLYHFRYESLIPEDQFSNLKTSLVVFSDIEKLFVTSATCTMAVPYIILTAILSVKSYIARRRTVYRYSYRLRQPLIQRK